MVEVSLWFDPDLRDLLKIIVAGNPFPFRWSGKRSVKDLIESLGIPHVEVDLILVNKQPVDLDYVVLSTDAIEVLFAMVTWASWRGVYACLGLMSIISLTGRTKN